MKRPLILQQIAAVNADVWVLTESRASVDLREIDTIYQPYPTPHDPRFHTADESWVSIWSRLPVHQQSFETWNPVFGRCVEIAVGGMRVRIYGAMITWANDPGSGPRARKWHEHITAIREFHADWERLGAQHLMVVAGDFNETLKGPTRYGTPNGRKGLTAAIGQGRMTCVTDHIDGNIDHICIPAAWRDYMSGTQCWHVYSHIGKPVSDHYGLSVDVQLP
jgi:hypothetical protein